MNRPNYSIRNTGFFADIDAYNNTIHFGFCTDEEYQSILDDGEEIFHDFALRIYETLSPSDQLNARWDGYTKSEELTIPYSTESEQFVMDELFPDFLDDDDFVYADNGFCVPREMELKRTRKEVHHALAKIDAPFEELPAEMQAFLKELFGENAYAICK